MSSLTSVNYSTKIQDALNQYQDNILRLAANHKNLSANVGVWKLLSVDFSNGSFVGKDEAIKNAMNKNVDKYIEHVEAIATAKKLIATFQEAMKYCSDAPTADRDLICLSKKGFCVDQIKSMEKELNPIVLSLDKLQKRVFTMRESMKVNISFAAEHLGKACHYYNVKEGTHTTYDRLSSVWSYSSVLSRAMSERQEGLKKDEPADEKKDDVVGSKPTPPQPNPKMELKLLQKQNEQLQKLLEINPFDHQSASSSAESESK